MDSAQKSHQVDPSSFQSSRMGFTEDVSRVEGYGSLGRTPLTVRGYQTSEENLQTCDSCGKDFRIKNTYKRHVKSCRIKKNLGRKRKLDFQDNSGKKVKKRNLFDECSSSSSDHFDHDDHDENENHDDDENNIDQEFLGSLKHQSLSDTCISDDDLDKETEDSESMTSDDGELDDKPCHWSGISLEEMMDDLEAQPLPSPREHVTKVQKANAIIEWMCFFIVYWQLMCHVSDNGLEWLLSFIYQFLHVINCNVESVFLKDILLIFPTTMYMVRKLVALNRDNFTKYVACPSCYSLYHIHQCTKQNRHGQTVGVLCTNKVFHKQGTKICGAKLVKEVVLANGSKVFYPLKTYCYYSIVNQLEQMLKRPGFPQECEKWRNREKNGDVLYDVYDGDVWKTFQWHDGSIFFEQERHLGLMMNIDWFQPFKRRTDYSVGVIYFVLMNLPRHERFKSENVIIAGIIPPFEKEPSLNTFLEPVIDELKPLWKGLSLSSSLSVVPLKFVVALLCIASDVPAARKTCGFKSHAANKGCSKCLKNFPGGFAEKKDYSGFDRHNWKKRSINSHRRYWRKLGLAKSKSDYEKVAKKYGLHYSVLTTLDYFDSVRFHVIDPMHNLFLGIAKKTWKIWREKYLLNQQLSEIDKKIKEMNISTDVGRIGSKISANYGMFTAQEWKNWTTIHSMYVLSGILPESHLMVWERFVLACRILCQPVITRPEVMKADALLVNFCKGFESLYGKSSITPNMHLCCHLQNSMLDFGPVYAFWLFSFERYNGELAAHITNNRSVEILYMRKFITISHVHPRNGNVPSLYKDEFEHFFSHGRSDNIDQDQKMLPLTTYFNSSTRNLQEIAWHSSSVKLSSEYVEDALDIEDKTYLCKVYNIMFPQHNLTEDRLSHVINKHRHMVMGGEKYGSTLECRTSKSAFLLASWLDQSGNIDVANSSMRPAVASYYFSHKVSLEGGATTSFSFAVVSWNKKAVSSSPSRVLWMTNQFEPGGSRAFLPISRVHCRVVRGQIRNVHNSYFMVCPVSRKIWN